MLTMPESAVKERNRKMERQFNLHNNARPKKYEPDERVCVRNFGRGGTRWIRGHALKHSGELGEDTAGFLRLADTLPNTTPASTSTHAQDTTLRSPDSSEPNEDPPDMSPATADPDATMVPMPTPQRRSQRNRRPPIRLDVNPTQKTYTIVIAIPAYRVRKTNLVPLCLSVMSEHAMHYQRNVRRSDVGSHWSRFSTLSQLQTARLCLCYCWE
ncbi:hypothetical protein ANCDUO_12428 [Ancylostoma duodenale]|uniref:Uncharacterized protein n=1 Tax=Ancylostoma duodenale TaxID=51022 RepID=A0A0C2D5L3_9BILA|nr:hypothetical protein ANCDUO_12428 [Ancylostoma duodenale]